jgi:hypothetical protein
VSDVTDLIAGCGAALCVRAMHAALQMHLATVHGHRCRHFQVLRNQRLKVARVVLAIFIFRGATKRGTGIETRSVDSI